MNVIPGTREVLARRARARPMRSAMRPSHAMRAEFAAIARAARRRAGDRAAVGGEDRAVRAGPAAADRRRDRRRGPARASPAVRRRPRRHGDHRHRADRHAVRALQGRHQPQSRRSGHAATTSRRASRVLARFIVAFTPPPRADACPRPRSDPRLPRRASRRGGSASSPSWCACRPTIRPATARRTRSARRSCSRRWASPSSGTPCRRTRSRANGMVSCTNLVVRVRFGRGKGPVIALNAHGDVVPPGSGWTADPYGAEVRDGYMYGRGVAVSKSDFATYAFALRALEAAAAAGARARRHRRAALHLRRGGGRRRSVRRGCSRRASREPDLRDLRRLLVRHHHRAQRLPAPRGRGDRQVRPRRGAGEGHRRARGRERRAGRPLCAAQDVRVGALDDRRASRRRRWWSASSRAASTPTWCRTRSRSASIAASFPTRIRRRPRRRSRARSRNTRGKWPGVTVNVKRILLAVPFVPIPGPGEAGRRAAEARRARCSARRCARTACPIYTDARLYTTAGVPAVLYGAGPRTLVEANGHRADEKLRLADLHQATEVVALALADLLAAP